MEENADVISQLDDQISMHNSMVMAQIDQHLRNGLSASLTAEQYYAIRSETTRVLSVLSSSTIVDKTNVAFGPASFQECIKYVNSTVVTQLAEKDSLITDAKITDSEEGK